MNEVLILLLSFIGAYFIGNFCGAIIISKLFIKKDIRNFGSSNAGTTNMTRVFGIKFGLITFLIDCLKGFLAVKLFSVIISTNFSHFLGEIAAYLVGIAIILGHNYPIIFKFKGGKGFASVIGIYLAVNPVITVILLAVCLIVIITTDIMSLYAISFFAMTMLYTCIMTNVHWIIKMCTIIYFVLGVIAHRGNLKNFFKGEERKLGIRDKIFNKSKC